MRYRYLFLALSTLWTAGQAQPESGRDVILGKALVDQRDYPDSINGCGPASILNLLRFSEEPYQMIESRLMGATEAVKMKHIVDRYFRNRPSVVYPQMKRWGMHGVATLDLVEGLNDLLAENQRPSLRGVYLDRADDESVPELIERCHRLVHGSLQNGVTPILSVRSFAVKIERGKEPEWQTGYHHYLVVTDVVGDPTSIGFALRASDPFGGREVELFIHREVNGQGFMALRGNHDTGKWLSGEPFLQVVAPGVPSLRPRNLEWFERYFVTANFLIGDF